MADRNVASIEPTTPGKAKVAAAQPGDNLVGFDTVKGRDPAADGVALDAHLAAAAPHPGHATDAELATVAGAVATAQGEIDAHEAAGSPHANHATLVGGKVPMGQLASGTPNGSQFIRDDGQLAVPPGGGGNVNGSGTSLVDEVPILDNTTTTALAPSGVTINRTTKDVAGVRDLAARHLNPTGTVKGRDPAVDGPALDAHLAAAAPHPGHATDAELATVAGALAAHEAAAAPHPGHATDAELATVAAAAAQAQTEIDAHEAAVAPHADHLTNASNLASSGNDVVAEPEVGLAASDAGQLLELYSLAGSFGVDVARVGNSLRVTRRPRLWAPRNRPLAEGYTPVRSSSRRTAGAVGDNAASGPNYHPAVLLDNHGASDHLWPYMLHGGVDFYGIVHKFHRRLRGTSLSDTSAIKGFEFGHRVEAGHARDGQTFLWELDGAIENVGWTDAFVDFAVEINPTAGNFAGPNLMRLAQEIGATFSGERHYRARIELVVRGRDSCVVRGEWTLFSSSGAVLRSWECDDELVGAHDWLTTAARLQLRWRVDRDIATRLNTFDGLNQGERQGANLLRCHVDNCRYAPLGLAAGVACG